MENKKQKSELLDVLKSIENNKKAKPQIVRKAISVNKYFTSIMYEELKSNTRAYKAMYDFLSTLTEFDKDEKAE